ncbi:MAG: c-type cytochrome biogenesis protein CcmI [Paracoccaceae bacterium]|jgi:cytochrome c-type biogenesis protein CcmH|nr:c-type cytochrome biogenesis protein CcmI [Paracoccaceae bacterium]
MLFWIIAIGAAVLTTLIVALPLLRGREDAAPRAAHDVQVFRDQLTELDRDVARGAVTAEDADATKLEIQRRLLAADAEMREAAGAQSAPAGLSRGLAVLVLIAIPGATGILYYDLGAPGAQDTPFAARADEGRPGQEEAEKMMAGRELAPPAGDDVAEFEKLVVQLEARIKASPDDAQGVFLYARSLMNLGRFADAWPQFERLVELGEASAEIYAGLTEGQILAAGGYISPEAETNLLQIMKYQPTNPSARYYLGRLHIQAGEPELARTIWEELMRESPPDAPWVAPIQREMAELGRTLGPLPGPTQQEMQAAGNIPAEERQSMVQGMVASLATRLAEEGGSMEEWQQLIRSYSVLGDPKAAQAAMDAARKAFAGDPAALARLESGEAPQLPGAALPGPDGDDIAAAQDMAPADRAAMIQGMVGRLAERLQSEGGTVDEWLRLISSYGVMGRQEEASAAYEAARRDLAGDAGALSVLESAFEGAPRAPAGGTSPGPTQEDIAAAAEMEAEDRKAMIQGMVARLHGRLSDEGRVSDVNDWGKLMRSYKILGETGAIREAYEEAVLIYADDAISLAYLKEAALLNGVTFE